MSKNKFFATTATAALVASAIMPAASLAAETKTFTDAGKIADYAKPAVDYLVGKGAITGFEDGSFNPQGELTRAQAVTILVKALDIEVKEGTKTDFEDAKDHWATEEIAALQAYNNDIIKGFEDGSFRPNEKITRAQLALIITKAYDLKQDESAVLNFTDNTAAWSKDAVNTLASLGIVAGTSKTTFAPNAIVTREQAAAFFHRTEVENVRLEVETTEAKVVSVSAINAKKIEVKFNKEVSETDAETAGKYTILGATGFGNPELQEDGKTVILTSATAIANETTIVVTVDEIATKADSTVKTAKFTKTLAFNDVVRPELKEVKYPAPGVAEIKFTEELSDIGTVKVFDGLTDVTATIYTNAHTAGESYISLQGLDSKKSYKVVITGAKDQSGNLIAAPIEVAVSNSNTDTVAPTVTNLTANAVGEIKVQFSEGVQPISPATKLTVKVDGYDTTANTTQTYDSKTNTYTITGLESASGVAVSNNSVHAVAVSGYEDLVGNDGEVYSKVLSFSNAAPKLQNTSVVKEGNDTFVLLTFDKDVTFDNTTQITGSYVTPESILKDVVNADITEGTDVSTTDNKLKVKVTAFAAGNYTLSLPVDAISNGGINNDKAVEFKFTLGGTSDTTTPTVQNVYVPGETFEGSTVAANTVFVKYSKNMSQAALNANNYTVDGQQVFKEAVFVGDKTLVKLTIKEGSIGVSGNRNFYVNTNVTGENNVAINAYSGVETFTENVKPALNSAKIIDGDTIELTFSEFIKDSTASTTEDFEVYIDGVKVAISSIATGTTANDHVITVDLARSLTPQELTSSTVTIKVLDTADVTDMATISNTITTGTVVTVQK